MKKRCMALVLVFVMALSLAIVSPGFAAKKDEDEAESIVSGDEELHGVWVSIYDFDALGFKKKTKGVFQKNVKQFMKKAKNLGINAVFFQVRANDDAVWASDVFPACSHLSGKASSAAASDVYAYDPLEIVVDCAHDQGIELHAWMNPYRINATQYLDPALAASQNRVKTAAKELLEYDIDGIHFDDYFYHASEGYVSPSNRSKVYPIYLSNEQKCANVNKLVKAIYKLCHKTDRVFGISPQANLTNDLASGADVPTWFSAKGYVDYVAPQIYWTDNYRLSTGATTAMFTERLNQFKGLQKNSAKLYVGLALYRAGVSDASDKGWSAKNSNLADQLKKLRKADANGFILFSAHYMFTTQAYGEMQNFENEL